MSWRDPNFYLDRITSLNVRFGRRSYPAFNVCGVAALGLAVLLGVVLGAHQGLPWWALILGVGLALFTFYAVALATKILTGEEGLTFYHQLITVTIVISGVAWLLGQPVLTCFDVIVIAVGATLTFGRIGCLMVGCCHGRPWRFGVRYGEEHRKAGFIPHLVGVRLFPIQAVEFLCVIPIEIVGCFMIWRGYAPGAAASWFIASYCLTRFCFEFARWPPNYQFRLGLSQYQWISVVVVLFTVSLEFTGVLPFRLWHAVVLVLLLLMTAVLVVERRLRSAGKQLSHPEHIRELTAAIDLASRSTEIMETTQNGSAFPAIPIGSTSLGLQISAGKIECETGDVYHYALSCGSGLTEATVNFLAREIVRLQRFSGTVEVLAGSRGVFHLLVHSARSGAL